MTTLNNARRALLELEEARQSTDKFTADRISVIGAYLDAQVALNVENIHTPGSPGMTAGGFHALYGKQLKVDNVKIDHERNVMTGTVCIPKDSLKKLSDIELRMFDMGTAALNCTGPKHYGLSAAPECQCDAHKAYRAKWG